MANVVIYTTDYCPYCDRAKALLDRKGQKYTEIRVDHDEKQRAIMMEKSQRRTVPQIFIDDRSVGGFDDLYALDAHGELDTLLTFTEIT